MAALIFTMGFPNIAEPIMRLAFIGWVICLIQALKEYKRGINVEKNFHQ